MSEPTNVNQTLVFSASDIDVRYHSLSLAVGCFKGMDVSANTILNRARIFYEYLRDSQ